MFALQLVISGVLVGFTYSLIGMAVTLLVGVIGIIDLSQGAWVLMSMYVAYEFGTVFATDGSTTYYLTAAFAVFIITVLAWLTYAVVFAPVVRSARDDPHRRELRELVLTLAISLTLSALILLVWTATPKTISVPGRIRIATGIVLPLASIIAAAGALMIMAAVATLLYRTLLGRKIRAVTQDPMYAAVFGIKTRQVARTSYAIGVAVSACAGVLIAPTITLTSGTATEYLLIGVGVMALGSIGSLKGAAVGGLVVGVVASVSQLWLGQDWQIVIIFVLIVIGLASRSLSTGEIRRVGYGRFLRPVLRK
jgi:branched-chain amino acid transport system permease protein